MTRLGRRMQTLAAVEISLVLVALILAGALMGFGVYVHALTAEVTATQNQLTAALAANAPPTAAAGGAFAASRYLPAGVEVIVLDADRRVTVFRQHRTDPQPVVNVRARGDLSGDPAVSGPLVPLISGLATALGLQAVHAHAGGLYLIIQANEAVLVNTVRSFFLPIGIAVAVAALCGWLVARALTRQAMRPLDDVTAALARFAAGDLTPQPIAADDRHDLASLAVAYNGAIEQMERAFAARDRANAAMQQFIADAGHQLRTPLTVVQGFIAILRRGREESPEERERILDTMYRQSRIMGALIDKLILLERWERAESAGAPEPIDVGVLVADLVTPMADAHPERRISVATGDGMLAAIDPSELGYVVTNLVDNALKYTAGEIDVRVAGEEGSVIVEVADRGPGISPEEAAHVFDRFYRGTRRDVEGSGLGLAIAKRAVERAHGSIALSSDTATGTRFTVRIPRAAA